MSGSNEVEHVACRRCHRRGAARSLSRRTNGAVGLALLVGAGCSGGGGGGGGASGAEGFHVDVSLEEGAVWQINRPIVLTFSEPVDFSTVSLNTIRIHSAASVPATGVFRLEDPRTVSFQPSCPTLDDYSDAGLAPGGVSYVLRVPGKRESANTVRSSAGRPLGTQLTRTFATPAS